MSVEITRLKADQADFDKQLNAMLAWESVSDKQVNQIVDDVIEQVRARGDAALVEYTNRFDRMQATQMSELEVSQTRLLQALQSLPLDQRTALEAAAQRISAYHERQKSESWRYTEADGTVLGQQVTPMDRIGIYVPGA